MGSFWKVDRGVEGTHWKALVVALAVTVGLLVFIYGPSSGVFDSEKTSEAKRVAADFEIAVNQIRIQWSAEGGQSDTVEFNEQVIAVTDNGWAKQLNSNVAGCTTVWNSVLPNAPKIEVYNREVHAKGWSVGGGPNVCYFINQGGVVFKEEATPYFRYSFEIGQVSRFNM